MSEAQEPTTEAAPTRDRSRIRSVAYYVTLVVAGILLLLSTYAVWVNRVALNTSVFVNTNTKLIENPQIRQTIATTAVDDLYSSVDVQAEIQKQLPKDFKSLAGPAAAALRQAAYTIVDKALQQPEVQKLFAASLEEAHKTLVQVLSGGGPSVSTQNGVVTLDLRQIMVDAANRIGIGSQVASKIPANAGRIVVLRSNELSTAQSVFQLAKTLAWVLPILTLLAFGLAFWLARPRRRQAVRGIGVTILATGVVASDRDTRKAASAAWDIVTVLMRSSLRWFLVVGILFVIAAWLAGPGRRAIEARQLLAPAMRERLWPYVGLAIVAAFLLFTGPVADTTRYLFDLVFLGLIALWIEVTRSQTLQEFPDGGAPAIIGDARTRVSGWVAAGRARMTPTEKPASAGEGAGAGGADVASRLQQLAALHASGELSDEEYASAKARVLGSE